MKLYILRHFQRYDQTDFYTPLTEEGKTNSEKFVTRLKTLGITHIYCSPYLRVLQTVLPYVLYSGINIKIDYLLKEMQLEHNMDINKHGYGLSDIPKKYHTFIDQSYDPGEMTFIKDPETFDDVLKRSRDFVCKISKNHNNTDKILIVTHSSVLNSFKQFTNLPVNDDIHIYGQLLEVNL